MTELYCSVSDVKLFCQINFEQLDFANDVAYEAWIEGTLIYKAMDMVDGYVRHNFQDNLGTIYVDGRSRETVHLTSAGVVTRWPDGYPEFPIGLMPVPLREVTALSINAVVQSLTNFRTYNTHVAYRYGGAFNEGRQNVIITARFGYGTVPHDIQYVTAQLCAHVLADMVRMRKMPDLVTPVLEGGGNLNMLFRSPSVITKNEKEIMNKYRFHAAEIT